VNHARGNFVDLLRFTIVQKVIIYTASPENVI